MVTATRESNGKPIMPSTAKVPKTSRVSANDVKLNGWLVEPRGADAEIVNYSASTAYERLSSPTTTESIAHRQSEPFHGFLGEGRGSAAVENEIEGPLSVDSRLDENAVVDQVERHNDRLRRCDRQVTEFRESAPETARCSWSRHEGGDEREPRHSTHVLDGLITGLRPQTSELFAIALCDVHRQNRPNNGICSFIANFANFAARMRSDRTRGRAVDRASSVRSNPTRDPVRVWNSDGRYCCLSLYLCWRSADSCNAWSTRGSEHGIAGGVGEERARTARVTGSKPICPILVSLFFNWSGGVTPLSLY